MPLTCWIVPYNPPGKVVDYTKIPSSENGLGSMRNGDIVFFSCPLDEFTSADWLAIGDTTYTDFETLIPRERRILFLMEPPESRIYQRTYLERFGVVVSPYDIENYTGHLIRDNPCLGWWAGASVFTKLSDVENFKVDKTKTISIISSLLGGLVGHRKRLAFLNALMEHYGTKMDYYGRGFSPVNDKIDAIAPYKYHIAIENSHLENYWTEKLADAWVGWSLPIYYGDPAIASKIPDPAGIEIIDLNDIPAALRQIDALLENDVYESRLDAIEKCRKWALKKANMLERICEIITEADESVKALPQLESGEKICSPRSPLQDYRSISHLLHYYFVKGLPRRIRSIPRIITSIIKRRVLVKKIRRNYERITGS